MTTLKQAKKQKAIAYLLAHPDASKATAARETKLSPSTIARARQELVQKGLLAVSRNTPEEPSRVPVVPSAPPTTDSPPKSVSPPDGGSPTYPLTDNEAMQRMGEMTDEAIANLDDDEVQRLLMRQAQRFAFNPNLHPDTRMSASQLWAKLRDLKREKDLGPGKPMTYEDAVDRTTDVLRAVGPEVAAEAVQRAFYSEGSDGKKAEQTGPASGTSEAPSEVGHDDSQTSPA